MLHLFHIHYMWSELLNIPLFLPTATFIESYVCFLKRKCDPGSRRYSVLDYHLIKERRESETRSDIKWRQMMVVFLLSLSLLHSHANTFVCFPTGLVLWKWCDSAFFIRCQVDLEEERIFLWGFKCSMESSLDIHALWMITEEMNR